MTREWVVRAERPERTAPRARDHYRVEYRQGRRSWLLREGLYGRETVHPAWFLHGLFG